MRIARRRTRIALLPGIGLPLAAIVAGVAVAYAAVGARDGGETVLNAQAPLAMADAFGLGGLASMTWAADTADVSAIAANDIVSYYGSPRTPSMGILGQHEPAELSWLLSARAARFDEVNGERGVLPALHLVYGVAQPEQGREGLHLRYVDDRTVRQYLRLARRNGLALVLDLQIGHSAALAEVVKLAPYLREPDVFVSLDPEFALAGGAPPGEAIGTVDAGDINAVQWLLAELSTGLGLPRKLLVVHQFEAGMISRPEAIERRSDVDLVINMDGFGPGDIKAAKYARYGGAAYAPHGGIKIFLEHDPDPLTEDELVALAPRPILFMYQ